MLPDLLAFEELARATLGGDVDFTITPIDPEVNWVAKSLEGLAPVIAGGFFVYGSHSAEQVPPVGLTPLHIEAALAFGTGHHETTTGCLEAIEQLLKRRRPRRMLDVGTGTGVLAIALAKRTHRLVVASDIDPIATRTTIENARDNQRRPADPRHHRRGARSSRYRRARALRSDRRQYSRGAAGCHSRRPSAAPPRPVRRSSCRVCSSSQAPRVAGRLRDAGRDSAPAARARRLGDAGP